ncbi:acetyl-CoA synthetase-like protein [Moesziomyces antarcticus]|uniref:Related to LYS2 - L-aminoadipate-semialdehyde dehydrogenase, large subunit n=2 Tax=Pseudozyma antarctica TaxID=84753 RepID=A0A5C3FNH8_PSEA2|nr:acetyl-CoA synthetase-like protein [Moesziomyces antarcticus]GAK64450.1 acetyl-CoA synthetase-like protein [Moesziomyces antarcticus]SPO45041.1 related to LYS2 - L-aminoadipate-semialdehyde dehydrogenase, large subunit [Moesziomyces antarcticus]
MGSISADRPPYLTLTISQALSLEPPPAPEPRQHESVNAMLDTRAEHMPHKLAVGFTSLKDKDWHCESLTYAQVRALAIKTAHDLQASLPPRCTNAKSPNGTPLVAVLAPSGLDLFAHIVALWRLGYGVLCIAPGSPAEAIANLLRLTETTGVLAHASQLTPARAAIDTLGDEQAHVVEMLRASTDGLDQEDGRSWETTAGEDVLVTMHTSGSSGLPKPIYQLNRFWTASMLTAPGRELCAFTTTPLFHGGMSDLLRSIQAGSTIFFHPTADPGALSTAAICRAIDACPHRPAYFLSVPYILDMMFTDAAGEGAEALVGMQLVSTGGAPLPQQLGDQMVAAGVRLVSRLGSSECGFLMSSWRDFASDSEWNSLRIPDILGQKMLRFEPQDPSASGGLYELIVDAEWPTKLVSNREDGGYATSDLYAPHDSLPNTWRYDSRSDDTLVLVSGKKATAPVGETRLKAVPFVSEAIVFGANRAILGALVFVTPQAAGEGAFDDAAQIALLRQLQPVLAQINAASPPHAQLALEMVRLLPPSEAASIPRASKGSLQRGRAYVHFAPLIDQVYADFEEGRSLRVPPAGQTVGGKQALEGEKLVAWLVDTVERINGTRLAQDADVFVAGVDSIQSARIRAAVHQNVELGDKLLGRNAVYEHPTLALLAQHISDVRNGNDGDATTRQSRELELMHQLVAKYSRSKPASLRQEAGGVGTLFILTGVTGGLGAQLLDRVLSQCSGEDHTVCLVRASNDATARDRVLASLDSRFLSQARGVVETDRVECLAADLSRRGCGLRAGLSRQHGRVVTIHAAWSVNFVAGLSSFEADNIAGVAHLLDLHDSLPCAAAADSAFVFCSSVASILANPGDGGGFAENVSREAGDAVAMGYARSKWVAEQLIARHPGTGGQYAAVRIGQLCSDTAHGVWNQSEAWPILIQISQAVGCFPVLNERLDWIPTDVAAQTVLDIALSASDKVYNVAQPTTASQHDAAGWDELYKWLAEDLHLELVQPLAWLEAVRRSDCDSRGLLALWERNFARTPDADAPRFVCDKALALSNALRAWGQDGVDAPLIHRTVQHWRSIGFLK